MIEEISIDKIKPSTTNPRQVIGDLTGLKNSITQRQEQGKRQLIHPIVVRKIDDSKYEYEVIIGMRRYTAMKELGFNTIECIIEDYTDLEGRYAGIRENKERKDMEWWEEARIYYEDHGRMERIIDETTKQFRGSRIIEGMSVEEIAKESGCEDSYINNLMSAYKVVLLEPSLKAIPYSVVLELSGLTQRELGYFSNLLLKEKILRKEIRQRKNNCRMINTRFELLGKDSPMYKLLYEFWYPLRYEKNSYKDMEEEIAIREGHAKKTEFYYPAEKVTEEQAKQLAKEQMGEYLGTVTGTFHRVFGVSKTVEQLRNKWSKKE